MLSLCCSFHDVWALLSWSGISLLTLRVSFFLRMMEVGQPWSGRQSTSTWTRWSCCCPKELTSASGTRLAEESVHFVLAILYKRIKYKTIVVLFSRRRTSAFTGQRSLAAWTLPSCSWMPTVICRPSTSTETLRCTSPLGRIAWTVSRELLPPGRKTFNKIAFWTVV